MNNSINSIVDVWTVATNVPHNFVGFVINTTAYYLAETSLQ